ncbi:MAG: hypothetical protein AB8I08_23745 [Sandaracinaceae bacterium]
MPLDRLPSLTGLLLVGRCTGIAPTPVGAILRLRRTGDEIRVAQVAIPAVGQSVAIGIPADRVLPEQLTRIGLTGPESQAFETGWFAEFFDARR